MDIKRGRFLNYFCAMIVVYSQNVIANDDEYLSLLEAEAENTSLDSGKSIEKIRTNRKLPINVKNKEWLGQCGSIGSVLPSNIQREEFFSYLEQCSMTTFSLYRRLDNSVQHSVYKKYAETSSIKVSTLRKEILKVY